MQIYKDDKQDVIRLSEIFMMLWKQKVLIIGITTIVMLITGSISIFLIPPKYQSNLGLVISMPEVYKSKYGEYILPITSNQQYIDLITSNDVLLRTIDNLDDSYNVRTIEKLRDMILVKQGLLSDGKVQNSFEVIVSAENPEKARHVAKTLYDNYIKFLDIILAKGAINYYLNDYTIRITNAKEELVFNQAILENNEKLLSEIPKIINRNETMKELGIQNVSTYIVLENIINPNYTKVENDIILNKQALNEVESKIELYESYLDEMDRLKMKIEEYSITDELIEASTDILGITKIYINLPSEPVAPSRKTSPSNAKNIVVGAFIGIILSFIVALIREFWFGNSKAD